MSLTALRDLQTIAFFLKLATLVALVDRVPNTRIVVDFKQTFGVYQPLDLDLFADAQVRYVRQHEEAIQQTLQSFVISGVALNAMLGFCEALDLDHDAIPELPYDKADAARQVLAILLYGVAGLIQKQAGSSDRTVFNDPQVRRQCLLGSCNVIVNDHQPEIKTLTLKEKKTLLVELLGLASLEAAMSDQARTLLVEICRLLEVDPLSVTDAMEVDADHHPSPERIEVRPQALPLVRCRRSQPLADILGITNRLDSIEMIQRALSPSHFLPLDQVRNTHASHGSPQACVREP